MDTAVTEPNPYDVEVTDTHIFWTVQTSNVIRRASLDGTGTINLISATTSPYAIDIAGDFLYWSSFTGNTLRRTMIDGSGNLVGTPIPDNTFIPNVTARDAQITITHIYLTNEFSAGQEGSSKITRTDPSGTRTGNGNLITGIALPSGLEVTATHIYWSDQFNGTLHRARLDGSESVVLYSSLNAPKGVAVFEDAQSPPAITQHPMSQTVTIKPNDLSKAGLNERCLTFTPSTGAATYPFASTFRVVLHAATNAFELFLGVNSTPTNAGRYLFRRDLDDPPAFAAIVTPRPFSSTVAKDISGSPRMVCIPSLTVTTPPSTPAPMPWPRRRRSP